jgi:KDO2-lipid IV(A) lauroyltransferase
MRIRYVLEYILFQSVAGLLNLLPLQMVQRKGAALGGWAYALWGRRRRVALDNLAKAFPEKSRREIESIARGAFRNVGISLLELVWFSRMTPDKIRRLVRFDKPDLIRERYAEGKGLLLFTAHFGNWELLAQSVKTNLGIPVHIIVKTQSNPLVDKRINQRRIKFGNLVIPMETSLREVLKALRAGGAVGIVADQAAPRENVAIEFFGRKVPTHQGPAVLSLKVGSPLVALFSVRQADGSYQAYVREIPTRDLGGYTPENVVELTKRHTKLTEEFIREHPDHWMWMHKRWKHVPSDEEVHLPVEEHEED